jgi:hypothetical protein
LCSNGSLSGLPRGKTENLHTQMPSFLARTLSTEHGNWLLFTKSSLLWAVSRRITPLLTTLSPSTRPSARPCAKLSLRTRTTLLYVLYLPLIPLPRNLRLHFYTGFPRPRRE